MGEGLSVMGDRQCSYTGIILFAYSMVVIFDTPWFCMETVFYCSNFGLRSNDFNLYVMGKKYVLSFLSVILVL